ncbi:HNH/ENDO VII superfamily nuclease [Archangium gephyra]|uniref:HNH/ENDO VII superfamily nuclease n=1 Tax=Archangium gephyra TaxID=48 RepID=A0AAC8Q387_9BACT|nr:putative lipoprotein [Archangium gephyra]REG27878.1 HNH/ENDO VII superfamily nuclease [Archangium gephyra]
MWRLAVALSFVLPACATAPEAVPSNARPRQEPKVVEVRELPGDGLRLVFEPVALEPALARVRVEEARAVLADFHASFPREEGRRFRLVRTSTGPEPEEWERRLREEFVSRFGPPAVPLPGLLETSPVLMALKLSPRYMGEGVRDAARELFRSPVFLSSVALSVLVYFAAWVAPEPIFTKAFVTALTVRLALLVGVLELNRFARACARLYEEAQAARTVEELEAVAERFGRAVGGTGLRVMMLAASMGVARGLPEVPQGGLGALLRAPRYSLPGGGMMNGAAAVQMVADGTIVVTGAAAGTAASAVGSACTDGTESKEGYRWHHLATNKNDISERSGGPWTPIFEELFARAGMSLEAKENLVYVKGHKGPHPEDYHQEVHQRLQRALGQCRTTAQCRAILMEALKSLADEVCTDGSRLHRLLTKSRD